MKNINEKIKERISEKKTKMKPKSYFWAIAALYIVSTIVIVLFALFLASFIFFALRVSGANYLLGFGIPGILSYFQSAPWLLILALIVLVFLVEIFSKKINLVSKKPLIYSFAAVVVVVIGFGLVFANSDIHHSLLNQALDNHLPLAGPLYKNYGTMSKADRTVGEVVELQDDKIILEVDGENLEILISDQTHKPRYMEIEIGDQLYVFGENNNGQMEALGVRKFDGDKPRFKGSKIEKAFESI